MVSLRGGFAYEQGIFNDYDNERTTVFTGPSAGFTVELPMSNKTRFGIDYSYRVADPLPSVHTFGVRITL